MNSPALNPGTLPGWMLEQTELWPDTQGNIHRIEDMDLDFLEFSIDYLLAHARRLRTGWAMERQRSYDPEERPRRWMLRQRAVREMLRLYAIKADARERTAITAAFEEANHPSS